uniref:SDR family NAD(P)-dependent oxidoreductase n=1 Tax=Pseudomonas sp. TaxID=306 RepID=UPI002584E11E
CATKAAVHSYSQSLRYQLKDTAVKVHELAPPYVQTELMGERQANDPHAMPLKEFIDEVMGIFQNSPDVEEILVERVKPLRFAEVNGGYADFFKQFNDQMVAARVGE